MKKKKKNHSCQCLLQCWVARQRRSWAASNPPFGETLLQGNCTSIRVRRGMINDGSSTAADLLGRLIVPSASPSTVTQLWGQGRGQYLLATEWSFSLSSIHIYLSVCLIFFFLNHVSFLIQIPLFAVKTEFTHCHKIGMLQNGCWPHKWRHTSLCYICFYLSVCPSSTHLPLHLSF